MPDDVHLKHDKNFAAMSMAQRLEVCDFLRHEFPPNFFEQIKLGHFIFRKTWWQQEEKIFNMNEGLAIRTALRKAGYSDYDLPCGNWDDVYIPVLEAAAGVRPVLLPEEVEAD